MIVLHSLVKRAYLRQLIVDLLVSTMDQAHLMIELAEQVLFFLASFL